APAARGGVVGDGGVAVAAPVAQGVAGAGRDEQRRGAVARPLSACPGAGVVRYRKVPDDFVLLQSQRLAEAADGVEDVDPGPVGNAFVDEQPVQVLRARAVVADAALR